LSHFSTPYLITLGGPEPSGPEPHCVTALAPTKLCGSLWLWLRNTAPDSQVNVVFENGLEITKIFDYEIADYFEKHFSLCIRAIDEKGYKWKK
jgi:hypothetical protein